MQGHIKVQKDQDQMDLQCHDMPAGDMPPPPDDDPNDGGEGMSKSIPIAINKKPS